MEFADDEVCQRGIVDVFAGGWTRCSAQWGDCRLKLFKRLQAERGVTPHLAHVIINQFAGIMAILDAIEDDDDTTLTVMAFFSIFSGVLAFEFDWATLEFDYHKYLSFYQAYARGDKRSSRMYQILGRLCAIKGAAATEGVMLIIRKGLNTVKDYWDRQALHLAQLFVLAHSAHQDRARKLANAADE